MRHLRRSWSILRDLCFQTLFALLMRRQRRPKKKRVRSLRDRIAAEVEQQGDEAFDKEQEAHAEDEIADSGVRVTLQSVDAEADNRKTEYDERGNTFVGASADPEDEAHDQTGEGTDPRDVDEPDGERNEGKEEVGAGEADAAGFAGALYFGDGGGVGVLNGRQIQAGGASRAVPRGKVGRGGVAGARVGDACLQPFQDLRGTNDKQQVDEEGNESQN